MQQQEVEERDSDQRQSLRRQNSEQITLSEKQKILGESGVVVHAASHSFGQSAKERKGSERDDQGRQVEPRDQQRVQPAAEQAQRQRQRRARPDGQSGVAPQPAADDRR